MGKTLSEVLLFINVLKISNFPFVSLLNNNNSENGRKNCSNLSCELFFA